MTAASESEILTRVGPDTLKGNMIRESWISTATSFELKARGNPMQLVQSGES
jgi:hypothetical protein